MELSDSSRRTPDAAGGEWGYLFHHSQSRPPGNLVSLRETRYRPMRSSRARRVTRDKGGARRRNRSATDAPPQHSAQGKGFRYGFTSTIVRIGFEET